MFFFRKENFTDITVDNVYQFAQQNVSVDQNRNFNICQVKLKYLVVISHNKNLTTENIHDLAELTTCTYVPNTRHNKDVRIKLWFNNQCDAHYTY